MSTRKASSYQLCRCSASTIGMGQAMAATFEATGLDPRLLRALKKQGIDYPTPVQAAAIPKALEGKDVVARARTGSGKTLAYLLPALQAVLRGGSRAGWQALVLVPTRELCEQVKEEAAGVAAHCGADIKVTALSGDGSVAAQRQALASAGQLLVTTPGRVAKAVKEGALLGRTLAALAVLVLDEADLLLSYGHEADLQALAPLVPRSCQVLLMSATSSADLERLQALVLHSPVHLNLLALPDSAGSGAAMGSSAGSAATITHYVMPISESDRLLAVLGLLRLGLLHKRVLLFVNGIDSGFRLRLFLEAFGVKAAILNAELPINSRHHILQEFNRGIFDYLIATDDVVAAAAARSKRPSEGDDHDDDQLVQPNSSKASDRKASDDKTASKKRKKGQMAVAKDEEFGITRGIDFKGVRTVVNVHPPSSVASYVHRVGRTGRAGAAGAALTLTSPKDAHLVSQLEEALQERGRPTTTAEEAADGSAGGASAEGAADASRENASTEKDAAGSQPALRQFERLTPTAIEALRYRGEDIARGLTKAVVQEARAKELRLELLNSERLTAHFEAHPGDLALLRHDKQLGRGAPQSHLRHLPSYLRDPATAPVKQDPALRRAAPPKKRRKVVGRDPLKGGFLKDRKRGGAAEKMTDAELSASRIKIKKRPGQPKQAAKKVNVRRGKGRTR